LAHLHRSRRSSDSVGFQRTSDVVDRGRIVVINGVSDHFVADSFGQFVDHYILDKNNVV
jgi:hypothetical protein